MCVPPIVLVPVHFEHDIANGLSCVHKYALSHSLIQFGPNLSSKAADWQGTILVDGTHVPAVVRHNRASVEKHENKNALHSYKIKMKSYNVFVFLCEPTCQVLHCEAVPGNCPDREAFVSLSGRTRAAHYGAALLGDDGFCGSAWEGEGGADIRRRWTIEVVNRRLKAFATFKQASVNIVDYYLQLQVVCWLVNEDMLVHPMRRVEEVDFKVCCFFYVCIFHVFFSSNLNTSPLHFLTPPFLTLIYTPFTFRVVTLSLWTSSLLWPDQMRSCLSCLRGSWS